MYRLILLLSALCFCFQSLAKKVDPEKRDSMCREVYNNWIERYLDLTRNCVGYSPPVAARTFFYLYLGNYEAVADFKETMRSMDGQLNGFSRTVWLNDAIISHPHLLNTLNLEMCKHFFSAMSPSDRQKSVLQFTSNYAIYKKYYSRNELNQAEQSALRLLGEIISYSLSDGGNNGYKRNFPESYKPPVCDGCWQPTYPGYTAAMLPFWGGNRLSINSNLSVISDMSTLTYSNDSSSFFYKENQAINDLYLDFKPEYEVIAEYWDDGPGITGTPAGHQFSIALMLAKKEKLSLERSCQLFLMLGIALNDAVIATWNLKFKYNLIRPISFIQEYINPEFHTIITTPPFPEFPSGHSFQAGAAGAVYTSFFGNIITFTDSTHVNRTDIDGSPRTYRSIEDMIIEMSLSRFYGGIHYLYTLNLSLEYGKRLGMNCLQSIELQR